MRRTEGAARCNSSCSEAGSRLDDMDAFLSCHPLSREDQRRIQFCTAFPADQALERAPEAVWAELRKVSWFQPEVGYLYCVVTHAELFGRCFERGTWVLEKISVQSMLTVRAALTCDQGSSLIKTSSNESASSIVSTRYF